ncbi:iron-containing alcohol dehydrogenase [Alicyclobacillus curvatus]|nr:iron-containing alcohol dehydrogenase [Alicyclobacillus curvatus]
MTSSMLEIYQHHVPTRIVGGDAGLLRNCGPELEPFRGTMAGLVTDKVILSLGLLDDLKASLASAGIELGITFADVPQDSDVETVTLAAAQLKAAGCNLLLAMGGGSVIDTAKAANILLTHGGDLLDYQGAEVLTEPLLPLVVIPTTVGTGSEVTSVAVIADRADHRKLTLVDHRLAPTVALLDPAVTRSLPPRLIAMTAMDALTHALEAYIDVAHNPFSDAWAVAAAATIRTSLLDALGDPELDVTQAARARLQQASTMAGIAFEHSMVGVVHAIAHALGGVAGVPHGLANALMLVEGLQCNAEVAPDRIRDIGKLSGFAQDRGANDREAAAGSPAHGAGAADDADDVTASAATIRAIAAFRKEVLETAGLPLTLSAAGVTEDQIPRIVERASEDGSMIYNPKYVEPEELTQMIRSVFI